MWAGVIPTISELWPSSSRVAQATLWLPYLTDYTGRWQQVPRVWPSHKMEAAWFSDSPREIRSPLTRNTCLQLLCEQKVHLYSTGAAVHFWGLSITERVQCHRQWQNQVKKQVCSLLWPKEIYGTDGSNRAPKELCRTSCDLDQGAIRCCTWLWAPAALRSRVLGHSIRGGQS